MAKKTYSNVGLIGEWPIADSTWKPNNDANLRALDALTQAVVVSMSLTTPPASPTDGACYVPATGATGAWASLVGKVVRYDSGNSTDGRAASWEAWTPKAGWRVYNQADGFTYQWTGAIWSQVIKQHSVNVQGTVCIGPSLNGMFSTLDISGANVIDSARAAYFTAVSISGLTNGNVPCVVSGSGLLGASCYGDDGSVATISRPLALNSSTAPAWGNTYAGSIRLGGVASLGVYAYAPGITIPMLAMNCYNDGTNWRVIKAGGASYLSVTDGGLGLVTATGASDGATFTASNVWRVSAQGGVGFYGAAAPTSRPAVTGSKASNAALASLITALTACGIISDSTT